MSVPQQPDGQQGRDDRPSTWQILDQMALDARLQRDLRKARCAQGLTQREVAARMRVSQAEVSRIENGRYDLSLVTLALYAHAVGVRIRHVVEADE